MSRSGTAGSSMRGDGLPTLPTGEPVLARWFVVVMLLLVPVAIAVTVWALDSIPGGGSIGPAERRPPGDATVTIDRGDAQLGESAVTESGPACSASIEMIGDDGTRAAARRALTAMCRLVDTGEFPGVRAGLGDWIRGDGLLRFATFELSGVESSARVEGERIVIELNAKFLFEDAARGVPALVHQLVLVGESAWPGSPVSADAELRAARTQAEVCERLRFGGDPPRGCDDVAELLSTRDPRQQILDAGFPP